MTSKRSLTILAALVSAALVIVSTAAASAPKSAALLIRHQTRGCHSWSLNGGPFTTNQTISLSRNGSLTITNNDLMPHALIETSGPAARVQNLPSPMGMGMHGSFGPGVMAHMGAVTKVTFPASGVYRFTTKAGEDYLPGIKTIGEDHVLRLIVHVR